jgi:hypothetical protein
VTYAGFAAFDDSGGGVALISSYSGIRGPSGWTTVDRSPVVAGPAGFGAVGLPQAMVPDYSRMIFSSPGQYAPSDTDGVAGDIYSVDNALGVELLTQGLPAPGDPADETAGGGLSADGSHFAFQATPAAGFEFTQVYERTGGQTRLVGIDPNGDPLPGAVLGGGRAQGGLAFAGTFPEPSAMSPDGSRIFFSDAATLGSSGIPRQLYMRENGTSTTLISESQAVATEGDPADTDVDFQMASPDGGSVFFITASQLTDDATAGGGLYRYDVDSGELTFLSTGSTGASGAQVLGVVRVSDDGSRAYFVARDALGGEGTAGQPNLYLWEGGALNFIATLAESTFEDPQVWSSNFGGEAMRFAKLTPDGSRLVFISSADLTPENDGGFNQVYLYDATADGITCISCPPGAPSSPGGSLDELSTGLNFNTVPGDISDDGSTILFQSSDALVPQDGNRQPDAYLWEDGAVHLLGSGSVPRPVMAGGMSADGTDVFFLTRESLVPIDNDGGEYDVYDARVGGGLPDQQTVPAEPCSGDECRPGGPPVTTFDPPGTVGFDGPGNVGEGSAGFSVRSIGAAARRRFARTGNLTLRVAVTEAGRVSARVSARVRGRNRTVARASREAGSGR